MECEQRPSRRLNEREGEGEVKINVSTGLKREGKMEVNEGRNILRAIILTMPIKIRTTS